MNQASDLVALRVAKKTAERAYFSAKYANTASAPPAAKAPKAKREPTAEDRARFAAFGAASSERAKLAKPIREEIKAANPNMPAKEVTKLVHERLRAGAAAAKSAGAPIADAPIVDTPPPAAEPVADVPVA